MSKLHAMLLLIIKLILVVILLVFCTAWPGYEGFGSLENVCVLIVILVTAFAFILEAVAVRHFQRENTKNIIWLVVAHILTAALSIVEAVCVFLYSQIASRNYERLTEALRWTSASDQSLILTADFFVKAISITIAILSSITGLILYTPIWKSNSKAADLDEICTSAYLETAAESEQATTGMHGSPYL